MRNCAGASCGSLAFRCEQNGLDRRKIFLNRRRRAGLSRFEKSDRKGVKQKNAITKRNGRSTDRPYAYATLRYNYMPRERTATAMSKPSEPIIIQVLAGHENEDLGGL